jgi:hypothetical protein
MIPSMSAQSREPVSEGLHDDQIFGTARSQTDVFTEVEESGSFNAAHFVINGAVGDVDGDAVIGPRQENAGFGREFDCTIEARFQRFRPFRRRTDRESSDQHPA